MKLKINLQEKNQELTVKFCAKEQTFGINFGEVQLVTEYVGGELYPGPYNVTPKVGAQTMSTKGCVMAENVTVKAIPIYETSNASGGSTIYIAKEI